MAAGRGIGRNGRSKRPEPYASISTTLLATKRLRTLARDYPAAFKVWLRAQADYTPTGPLLLPTMRLPKELHMNRQTLITARRHLTELGLLECTRAAIRPGGMASQSGTGFAAQYALPQRKNGAPQKFEQGDRGLPGMLRVNSARLREFVASMTPVVGPLFLYIAAQPRKASGELMRQPELSIKTLLAILGQPRRSIYDAMQALMEQGLLVREDKGGIVRVSGWLERGHRLVRGPAAGTAKKQECMVDTGCPSRRTHRYP